MNFLAPLFLLGTLAVGFPIVFHLIRRTTRERRVFSSLMFLRPSPPRLTQRSRLEHILLLILRCAAVCLLAFAFARPFWRKPLINPSSAGARRLVLLVDTSASMRRANLWDDVRQHVRSLLATTSPADQVELMTFARQTHPMVTFAQWNAAAPGARPALIDQALATCSPGWAATRLGDALIDAAEALADTGARATPVPGQIVLISDLQEGSRPDSLQGYEWPKNVSLTIDALKAKHLSNASLQLLAEADDGSVNPTDHVRLRVSNGPTSRRDEFQVGWAASDAPRFVGVPLKVYVPPGQSRTLLLPMPAGKSGPGRILLDGDEEDFDNSAFNVPPERVQLKVLYCGSESANDSKQPLYFLERAFEPTRRQTVQVLVRSPGTPLSDVEATSASLLIVTAPLPPQQARAMHDRVAAGQTLLFVLSTPAAAETLAAIAGRDQVTLDEAPVSNYAMLADIDFRDPLFAPFADPRFSDFTKIHFWKYRRIAPDAIPGARAIAKFDGGDPALLEARLGKGRLLVLSSGWQPQDSQLALSTKFVPMLYALLDESVGATPQPAQYRVADVIPLGVAAAQGQTPVVIGMPDGTQLRIDPGQTNLTQTLIPGIYTITSAGRSRQVAVNLDPTESRTTPLTSDELERLGAPLTPQKPILIRQAERKTQLRNAEIENRQKFWRWCLIAALGVLLCETWLAGRASKEATATHTVSTGNAAAATAKAS